MQSAVKFDAENKKMDAIACFSLLVLLSDRDTVQVQRFRSRLTELVQELDEEAEFSAPNAQLFLLDEDERDELVCDGLLQVFECGAKKLVVVGSLGFLAQLVRPEIDHDEKFVFRAAGFAVVLRGFPGFASLFEPPVAAIVLSESSRVVKEMTKSVSETLLAGASSLAKMIAPTATPKTEKAPQALKTVEEGSAALRSVGYVCFFLSFSLNSSSEAVADVSKRAGVSAASLVQENGKPMSATTSAAVGFLGSTVSGVLLVTGAAWTAAGLTCRATGEAIAEKVKNGYGEEAGANAQNGVEIVTNAVIAVQEFTSVPTRFVEGALQ